MKNVIKNPILLLMSILFLSNFLCTESFSEQNWSHHFFPKEGRVFPGLVADPWETQSSIFWINGHRQQGKIGWVAPLYRAEKENKAVFVGIDLQTFNVTRHRTGGGFSLETTDTKFGVHGEYKKDNWNGRFGIEHISAHLADGLLWPTALQAKKSYSREFLQFNLSYDFWWMRPYIGFQQVFNNRHPKEYEKLWLYMFQWGTELFYPVTPWSSLFVAGDFQSRKEYSFFTNQNYCAGIKFKGESNADFRVMFQHYRGFDPRGEYYNSKTSFSGLGLQYLI